MVVGCSCWKRKWPRRWTNTPEPGPQRTEVTVDEVRIPLSGGPFYGEAPDESPHACDDGWVTIGQGVDDPEPGEETVEYALYLCRRCSGAVVHPHGVLSIGTLSK